jgi:hypothetical protein
VTVRQIDTLNLSAADITELAQILEPEELAAMMRENTRLIREKLWRRKQVDIVATLRPASWHDARRITRLIAAGMCFLVTVILVGYLFSENAGHAYGTLPAQPKNTGADIGAVVFFAMFMAFAGAALVMWAAASVKRYRDVLRYGERYTAEVIMEGDGLRGTYGAFDAAVGKKVPLKVQFERDGRTTVMLIAGPHGTEIGEKITVIGRGNDFVVAPRDAA